MQLVTHTTGTGFTEPAARIGFGGGGQGVIGLAAEGGGAGVGRRVEGVRGTSGGHFVA